MIIATVYISNEIQVKYLEIRDNTIRPNTVLISLANSKFGEHGWDGLEYRINGKYYFISNQLLSAISLRSNDHD